MLNFYSHKIVFVEERAPLRLDTGLITPQGQRIIKTIHNEPIGFVHFEDEGEPLHEVQA